MLDNSEIREMREIWTIGYEGSKVEQFVAYLVSANISLLADVRELPLSRKPGFSKNVLRERLAHEGINYIHFRELGDPKDGRIAARAGDEAAFRAIYFAHLRTPAAQSALEELKATAKQASTCLMCFECDPKNCHRSIVAAYLEKFGFVTHNLQVGSRLAHFGNSILKSRYSRQGAAAA